MKRKHCSVLRWRMVLQGKNEKAEGTIRKLKNIIFGIAWIYGRFYKHCFGKNLYYAT